MPPHPAPETGAALEMSMTRMNVLGMWCAAVVASVAVVLAFGVTMTMSTELLLVALSLVTGAMILLLWPGTQTRTASDVLYDRNRPA